MVIAFAILLAVVFAGFFMTDVSRPKGKTRRVRPQRTIECKDGVLVSSFDPKK